MIFFFFLRKKKNYIRRYVKYVSDCRTRNEISPVEENIINNWVIMRNIIFERLNRKMIQVILK